MIWSLLKVSKFRKQISMLSFEPKNEQNYFLISALASKNGFDKKRHFIYIILIRGYLLFDTIEESIFLFDPF